MILDFLLKVLKGNYFAIKEKWFLKMNLNNK